LAVPVGWHGTLLGGFMKPIKVLGTVLAAAVLGTMHTGTSWAAGSVQTNPANWTPQMTAPTQTGYVRQLTPCGSTMYAVGTFSEFTSPADGGAKFTRHNAMAFSGTTGKMTAFNPNTNGIVNSIALSADCTTAWIGGAFSSVNGQSASNIAAVNAQTGALISSFAHSAGGQVNALLLTHGELLVGGYFSTINGSSRAKLASLNPGTGAADNYLTLGLTGNYPGNPNGTRGYNFSLSNSGTRALVTGDFTSVGGQHREQVFQIDLGATSATLDPWTSNDFYIHCADSLPFYIQDANYSPDDAKVYIATTGYKRPTDPLHTGVCDAAAAYPSTGGTVNHLWVNFSGCDSVLSVVADSSTVYIGGHQRWANNENGCDGAGPGALSRPGIAGFDPTTGRATAWNPTRSRGAGADDLVLAFNGLWIASDNKNTATSCGHEFHPGICFLPY
jgi:hypothetical protein